MSPAMPARLPAAARGFTLIELMVVIIIIGTLSTLAVLSLGDNAARRLDKEAFRFASLIRLAADEAILQGKEIGLEINREGYAFHQFDDEFRRWIPLSSDPVYRQRTLRDGLSMDLRIDDQALILLTSEDDEDDAAEDPPVPQILLLSSGEMTPFDVIIEIENLDRRVVVRASANGRVETLVDDDF